MAQEEKKRPVMQEKEIDSVWPKKVDETEGGRRLHRFTRERLSDETRADQNIEKDPVGPVKARARTTAMVNAQQAPGGDVYGDRAPQRKNNPDNPFVKGSN